MTNITTIFALAREAITAPNQLHMIIVPCAAVGWGDPNQRMELSAEQGEEYPANTVWLAIMDSDCTEEVVGHGATAEAALEVLATLLRERIRKRLAALQAVLGDAP